MATENILIKFTSDTSGLKDSVAELQKIGKLSEEDAKKFQMMEGFAEGVADALKEAGIDAKTLNKEIGNTVNSGKSLKAQFSDAKNEAVKLSREFGATSVEARNAAKSAALLKDEIDDMNGVLKALNPEAKLNAFVNLGQGVQGAFQVATGALQVFGVENERITKLAQQFQVLALASAFGIYKIATDESTKSLKKASQAEKDLYDDTLRRLNIFNEGTKKYKDNAAELDIQLRLAQGKITKYAAELERLALQEAQAIAEIQSKPWSEKSQLDVIAVRQIKRLYEVRRKLIEIEQAKENAKILAEQAVLADQAKNANLKKASILPSTQQVVEDVTALMDVVGTTVTTLSTDLPELPFFSEEELQQKKEDLATFFNDIAGAYGQLNNSLLALNTQLYENDLNNLKESKENGFLTEKQYNDRVKSLREKQFEINKKAQIAQAIIGIAQGVINALAVTPPQAVPAYVALAASIGAINLARILSTEAPKFKSGTLNVGGGNLDADGGMHAIIHKGEAIIPADRNREYHPTIKALYNRQVKASDINSFVQMKMNGKLPTSISAKLDTNKLGKMMRGSGVVELSNAKVVGKIIASELNKGVDIRRW